MPRCRARFVEGVSHPKEFRDLPLPPTSPAGEVGQGRADLRQVGPVNADQDCDQRGLPGGSDHSLPAKFAEREAEVLGRNVVGEPVQLLPALKHAHRTLRVIAIRLVIGVEHHGRKNATAAVVAPPTRRKDQLVPVWTSCRQRAVGACRLEARHRAAQRHPEIARLETTCPRGRAGGRYLPHRASAQSRRRRQAAVFLITAGG
jgi:hypothetical protein